MTYITSAERIGIQKGVVQGEKTALLRLLQHKFGDIPSFYRNCSEQADSDTLSKWVDIAIDANSLVEIF